MRKKIASLLSLLLLAACSFAPKDTGRAFMFALSAPSVTAHTPVNESLVVALPVAAPELDTYRIALTKDSGRWDYYAGARWSDFLPMLVQDSLTKTLEDARLFRSVNTDQTGVSGDYVLKAEIRTFQAAYEQGGAPVIKVKIMVSVRKRLEGTMLASFPIQSEVKVSKDGLPEIQAAFAFAFKEAQRQLADKLAVALMPKTGP